MHDPAHNNAFPCEINPRVGPRILVAGCGYLGRAVARALDALGGCRVLGITRSEESAQALCAEAFEVQSCDITDRTALAALGPFDGVIHCASSGRGGPDSYRQVYLEGARQLLDVFRPARFLFTGSTSVYAQTDGAPVTEASPAEPDRETGRILLEAEALTLQAGGTVARLGGLYGPGRWALLDKFLNGSTVIEGDGARWINQIHRDDAAAAVLALFFYPTAAGIYNVVDDTPVTQREIYTAFAAHFSRPIPPTAPPDLDCKRGWTHKRVSNAKLRALGWTPAYPSFKLALAAMTAR